MSNYIKGHTLAVLSVYDTTTYSALACITNRDESNEAVIVERINTCTDGLPVKTVERFDRSVSISGLLTDTQGVEELRGYQDKTERVFKTTSDGTTEEYFKGVITSLGFGHPADGDSTFDATIAINGDYLITDPNV